MGEMIHELEKYNGDFAALFISNEAAGQGALGTRRGADWPDYWWYSVLVMEKNLARPICGARTESGEMCTEDPSAISGRCKQHAGFVFRSGNPGGTYDLRTATSILMNKVATSFIAECEPEKCKVSKKCSTIAPGELCSAELDMFHQLAIAKIADTIRVGLPMNMTQILAIRRLVTNEIIMMRNDAKIAVEGSKLIETKSMISKFGETTEDRYVLNPNITANSLLAKQNQDIGKSSMLSLKSQVEAKIAGKIAEAASETVKINAGKALNAVLKEIHTMPKDVPGVGNLAELYGDIAGIQVDTPAPTQERRMSIPNGEIVYDEDGNQLQSRDGKLIPVATRGEIEI